MVYHPPTALFLLAAVSDLTLALYNMPMAYDRTDAKIGMTIDADKEYPTASENEISKQELV